MLKQKLLASLARSWIDLIFPPLCLSCKQRCDTKFLCPDCWTLCELPDPAERCRHCFKEMERKVDLCQTCRGEKGLLIPRAFVFDPKSPAQYLSLEASEGLAGFAFVQFIKLEWPIPDVLIPMPDPDSASIGKSLASLMQRPLVKALRSSFEYREQSLEEEGILLLFDILHPMQNLQKASLALSESSPKRIYLLSLFPYADCFS